MLVYARLNSTDYHLEPVPINRRPSWEFQACLTGAIAPVFPGKAPGSPQGCVLWCFPRELPYGWTSDVPAERLVFHFSSVPEDLARRVPACGYYQVGLSDADCARLRQLFPLAESVMHRPTELAPLRTQALLTELSVLALRDVPVRPLASAQHAREVTERALAYYQRHLAEAPRVEDVARDARVSPAHLRRLFHQARGQSPQEACHRLRMLAAAKLLEQRGMGLAQIADRVGFSSISALSRAVKTEFGLSPREFRQGRERHRLEGGEA